MALGTKHRLVLSYISAHLAERGYPPTLREIGTACGIRSTRSVSDYLKRLEREGHLRRSPYHSRGLELVGEEGSGIPVLGGIAAGAPIGAEPGHVETLKADARDMFGAGECFAVKVRGDSMIERHIAPGDYVVLRPQAAAVPGDVVAAEIDGEVTLKVYREDGARVVLMPANSAYDPIVLDGGPARILGVMVGLIRRA